MSTDFVSIDLETANPSPWSICQIGIAEFVDGGLAGEWMTYVDPEEWFNPDNVAIHGITTAAVRGWPKLGEVSEDLRARLEGKLVVSHSQFDRVALEQAFDRLRIERLSCSWLDSTMVARRAWQGFAKRGYGLENLCRLLGYRYQRHDALGDAKAAGVVVLAAIQQTGIDIKGWMQQVEDPISEAPRRPIENMAEMPHGMVDSTAQAISRPGNRVLSPEILQRLAGVSPGEMDER